MVPVAVDGLVVGLNDGLALVERVVLAVDVDLDDEDDDEADIAKRPKNEPNDECDAYTAPIRVRNGSF